MLLSDLMRFSEPVVNMYYFHAPCYRHCTIVASREHETNTITLDMKWNIQSLHSI